MPSLIELEMTKLRKALDQYRERWGSWPRAIVLNPNSFAALFFHLKDRALHFGGPLLSPDGPLEFEGVTAFSTDHVVLALEQPPGSLVRSTKEIHPGVFEHTWTAPELWNGETDDV